ncbi:MAG: C40 family peptidase [Candidatus Coproplasma sp.]
MKIAKTVIATAAMIAAVTVSGCAAQSGGGAVVPPQNVTDDIQSGGSTGSAGSTGNTGGAQDSPELPEVDHTPEINQPPESGQAPGTDSVPVLPQEPSQPTEPEEQPPVQQEPVKQTVSYIKVTGDGVNIRKGAGTSFSSLGAAEKNTLYALVGKEGSWYKTYYKNSTAYISSKYCQVVEMEKSDNEKIESIIAEGTRHMGTKYVYGATRYHNGEGVLLSGFKVSEFDCSSLVQYIFKKAVNVNLQVNTRTQVLQGTTVKRSEIKRGDLIFFTNSSRKHLTGIERIGHVALYLGDNLILHTASDYAKIEEISTSRWNYYVQTQRMI